jgi:hypothetical protein
MAGQLDVSTVEKLVAETVLMMAGLKVDQKVEKTVY